MDSITERRTTVTRTTRVDTRGADQLKANIQSIAQQISAVRDQARQEVSSLEKIRSMLDVGYLNDLLASVQTLEERIETLEREAAQASSTAGTLEGELAQERSRLEKLWQAYKAQEDELARLKRDYPLMEEKLFERERTIESLRREVSRLEPFARYKGEVDRLDQEKRALENQLRRAETDLERAMADLRAMEREMDGLRELGPAKERARELEEQLAEERERLAKLYKVYEDVEADKKALQDRLAAWDQWFRRVGPAMQTLCGAASDAPRGR